MNRRSFLQSQVAQIDSLLGLAGDHPFMGPNLRSRKEEVAGLIDQLPPDAPVAKASLYFTGAPVVGSMGIEADFAAGILDSFVRLTKSLFGAARHGHVNARRARRDELESRLLLTALPLGSFGMELTQSAEGTPESSALVSEVLQQATALIESAAAENDAVFTDQLDEIPSRGLAALRDLLNTVVNRNAAMRVVTGGRELTLDRALATRAYDRVAGTADGLREYEDVGVFRGVTLESWRFDFRDSGGGIISGTIADEVGEAQAAAMGQLTNMPARAQLRLRTRRFRDGRESSRYELLSLSAP